MKINEDKKIKNNCEYYLSNKILFSNQKIKILILNEEKFEFKLKNNKEIINNLNEVILNKKEIITYKEIINFENIKIQIEKLSNKKLLKPKEDDYKFIEKTSQIEILSQILLKIKIEKNIFELNFKIKKYCRENEPKIIIKIKNIEENIKNLNEIVKEIKNEIKLKKEIYTNNEKKIFDFKKDDFKINKNIEKLKKLQENNLKANKIKKDIKIVEKEIKKFEFLIEDNELEVKILKNKIKNLIIKISNGEKKDINIFKYVLTLGLIHWSKFSDNKYLKFKISNKINKIENSNLIIEKKIHKITSNLNEKKEELKEILKEESLKFEKIMQQIEILEAKLEKNLKSNLDLKINKNKFEEIIINSTNKFKEKNDEIKLLKNEIEFIEKNSNKIILKLLENINENRNKNIIEISNLINKIKKQKINILGNKIINIDISSLNKSK